MPDREPDLIIEDAGRFRSDREALESRGARLPSRLAPEPEDIDRVSREHNTEWRENLRDRIEDDDAGSLYGEMVRLPESVWPWRQRHRAGYLPHDGRCDDRRVAGELDMPGASAGQLSRSRGQYGARRRAPIRRHGYESLVAGRR